MSKLLIAHGVHWRHWDDGIVVFVSATCETHVLSLSLLPLFQENCFTSAIGATVGKLSSMQQDGGNGELQAVIELLVRLKICEVAD